MFDVVYKHFFGRTYTYIAKQRKETEAASKVVYLRTPFVDSNIIICLELVSKVHDEQEATCRSIGWTFVRPFQQPQQKDNALSSSRIAVPILSYRAPVYQGTPRALLYFDDPLERNQWLQKIPGSQLICSIQSHKVLQKVSHLIPENIIFSGTDVIPGLAESTTGGDCLRKPKLQRHILLVLDNLTVDILPHNESFEEHLCQLMSEERLHQDNLKIDGSQVIIMERRLKIGVHNGWTYLHKPQIVHLVLSCDGGHGVKSLSRRRTLIRTRSWSPSNKTRSAFGQVLSHQNRIKIPEMAEDIHLTVIFVLEYVISTPLSVTDRRASAALSLKRTQTSIVVVRWAYWKPFLSSNQPKVVIHLMGGPSPTPEREIVFQSINSSQDDGYISFTSTLGRRRDSSTTTIKSSDQMLPEATHVVHPSDLEVSNQCESPPQRPFRLRRSRGSSGHIRSSSDGSHSVFSAPHDNRHQLEKLFPDSDANFGQEIQELAHISGPHLPVIPIFPRSTLSGQGLSRAAYARLYSAGFSPILDRRGQPPEIINVMDECTIDLSKGMKDPLRRNVIVLQFLAFSRRIVHGVNHLYFQPKCLRFTFQFYRFPPKITERLLLSNIGVDLSSNPESTPYVLQRVNEDGTVLNKNAVGYEVKYCIDPTFLRSGEDEAFDRYLANQFMHIDVWDANSLMYVGSASVELKHLFRQGREAVQVTYELDVFYSEYCEEGHAQLGVPCARPLSDLIVRGSLHIRLANVGHVYEPKESKSTDVPKQLRARPVWESHSRLAAEITLNLEGNLLVESSSAVPGETSRKLLRMQAVRDGKPNASASVLTLLDRRKERIEQAKMLKLVEAFREQHKHEAIQNLLLESVAQYITLHVTSGKAEFFEYSLTNPWNLPQTITIECEDVALSVVTDTREWLYLKRLTKANGGVEENMFIKDSSSAASQVFLKPKETVLVPFRYQYFCSPPEQEHQLIGSPPIILDHMAIQHVDSVSTFMRKVFFNTPDGRAIIVLCLNISLLPPVIDRVFRFLHAENSFIKQYIRVPALSNIERFGRTLDLVALCSDPQVLVEVFKDQPGNHADVLFKASCGVSGSIMKCYIFLYVDEYQVCPAVTWLVVVQALQRLDFNCLEGESCRQSLILRGSHSTRLVQCFVSHPLELQVNLSDPFLLPANSMQEIQLTLKAFSVGARYMHLHVVDSEFHQLLQAWMICIVCRPPVITRTFQIQLPLGGGRGSNKRITFTNPYSIKKMFTLNTNRPELLQFRESRFEADAKCNYNLGLVFPPCGSAGSVDILVFINCEDEKNEETFCIKVTYA